MYDQVFDHKETVLDELLHEAHQAFDHEAPVVAHRVPPPQEVRDMDQLVNGNRQFSSWKIPFEFEEGLGHLGAGSPAGVDDFVHCGFRVVVRCCIQEVLECLDHLLRSLPGSRWADLVEGVRNDRSLKHEPVCHFGFAPAFHRVERLL